MKIHTKTLRTSITALGTLVFVFTATLAMVGVASASTADTLQPAQDIEYTETLIVPSIKIGKQGVGGVTFFNGTIVNSTTNDGANNPVTFGDDVRIDGEIYRTEKGGANALKFSDPINPTADNMNDVGSSTNQWKDGYFAGTVNVGALGGTGVVNTTNLLDGTIATTDLADSSVTSAKIADGTITGSDVNSSTNLSVAGISASGDVSQSRTAGGAVKAVVLIDGNEEAPSCPITRSWTYDSSTVSCAKIGTGSYNLSFNFQIDDRYWQVTPWDSRVVQAYTDGSNNNILWISSIDHANLATDAHMMIVIY